MSIKNKIATSNSVFALPIKYFFYKFNNKYYDVNNIIQSTEIQGDLIKITLKDGTILLDYAALVPAEIQFTERIKFGSKQKLDKIKDVDRFFFIYEILSELYVNDFRWKYFDIQKDDFVIDAGANIGGFTIQAAKKTGKNGKVIAVEPNERNMEVLKMNCKANKLDNVIFVSKGLWSKKDTLEFFESHRPGEHSLLQTDEQHKKFLKISHKIEVDTIDNIISELNFEKVDFLKMDIEGAEFEALKGGTEKLLNQENIKLAIEIHLANGEMTDIKIIPLLKEHKFQILEFGDSYRMPVFAKK